MTNVEHYVSPSLMEDESTITARGQTTIPRSVRNVLGVSKGEKLHYSLNSHGEVVLSGPKNFGDPAISSFINFLAEDIKSHPERLQTMNPQLFNRIENLTSGIDVDLDSPLKEEDE